MGILSWLIVGLIAGFIGSKVVNRTAIRLHTCPSFALH